MANLVVVHTPVHASWPNQIEIYFSVVERKALTPNDFKGPADMEARLPAFQECYERIAKPFKWTFTRHDLLGLLARVAAKEEVEKRAAQARAIRHRNYETPHLVLHNPKVGGSIPPVAANTK